MAGQGVRIAPLFVLGLGGVFLWSAITGKSVSGSLKNIIKGESPSTAPKTQAIAGTSASALLQQSITGGTSLAGTGSGLSGIFLSYEGKVPYVWGGANPHGWDCSGACNYVSCHVARQPIPGYAGGTFTGDTHGPPTMVWLAWAAANMDHLSAEEVGADDFVIWQTHMGIAINNSQYISAYDTQLGTTVQPIHGGGPPGEIASFWRYR